MPADAPRILCVESEALHVLREAAVSRWTRFGTILQVQRKLREVRGVQRVERRIIGKRIQRLLVSGKRSAQHRLRNEIDPQLEGVVPSRMADIITELIFLLVSAIGKRSNRRYEVLRA